MINLSSRSMLNPHDLTFLNLFKLIIHVKIPMILTFHDSLKLMMSKTLNEILKETNRITVLS